MPLCGSAFCNDIRCADVILLIRCVVAEMVSGRKSIYEAITCRLMRLQMSVITKLSVCNYPQPPMQYCQCHRFECSCNWPLSSEYIITDCVWLCRGKSVWQPAWNVPLQTVRQPAWNVPLQTVGQPTWNVPAQKVGQPAWNVLLQTVGQPAWHVPLQSVRQPPHGLFYVDFAQVHIKVYDNGIGLFERGVLQLGYDLQCYAVYLTFDFAT